MDMERHGGHSISRHLPFQSLNIDVCLHVAARSLFTSSWK
jgi:hypothetical protein